MNYILRISRNIIDLINSDPEKDRIYASLSDISLNPINIKNAKPIEKNPLRLISRYISLIYDNIVYKIQKVLKIKSKVDPYVGCFNTLKETNKKMQVVCINQPENKILELGKVYTVKDVMPPISIEIKGLDCLHHTTYLLEGFEGYLLDCRNFACLTDEDLDDVEELNAHQEIEITLERKLEQGDNNYF